MRDYGKVHTRFWASETIRCLSDDGRLLAMYLMTSPHSTIAGVFRLPDGYVCEDMQWAADRVAKAFSELFANGFANRCETTKWVWVVKHIEWNPPENPNQRKSAAKVALAVPDECPWKPEFMRLCGPLLGIDLPQTSNPSPTVSQPLANQEPEQEPEQKQEPEQGKTSRKRASPAEIVRPDDVTERTWADWQQLRKAKRAPVTETVVEGAREESVKAGMPLEEFLRVWCRRGSQGLEAAWLKPEERSNSPPGLNAQERLEAANAEVGRRFLASQGMTAHEPH